jgi:hypothetical protein
VGAALASKHHWLIIARDACDIVIDLDLTASSLSSFQPP